MSEVNDGWIKCTTSNEPPEGFRYDIRYADAVHVQSGNVSRGMMWSYWAVYDGYWRPSADDGWVLNDGTNRTGQVEYVCRNGVVSSEGRQAEGLRWALDDYTWTIIWWRPAASAVTEEPETKERDMSEVNEGWIPCTEDNQPPVGFRFDIMNRKGDVVLCGDHSGDGRSWGSRIQWGNHWRPAADDGWQLNDERKLTGQVDAVLRYGGVILDCDAVDLGWNVFDGGRSILWWRPAEPVKECEEPETKEREMSEVNDGWIKCMAVNEPPEGFGYDLNTSDEVTWRTVDIPWADRARRGESWRPAKCDGWKLNDGTKQTGQVDVVLRYGGAIRDCPAVDLGWDVFDDTHSILWWRPAASAATEESEESELSLLSELITAQDEYRRSDTRLVEAYEAIRDVMGERDRVIMRHGGELYLVEWDDTETVSWVQIEGI